MHPNYLMNCLAGGVSEKLVIHIFVKLISLVTEAFGYLFIKCNKAKSYSNNIFHIILNMIN